MLKPLVFTKTLLLFFYLTINTVTSTKLMSAPDEKSDLPIRIVPQISYANKGLIDPTGRFAAVAGSRYVFGLHIIDLKNERVAWIIEPSPFAASANFFTFSNDGKLLVFSSPSGGGLVDLENDQVKTLPWLKGVAPLFSPDDKFIYIATKSANNRHQERNEVDRIHVHNLKGNIIKRYPLKMNFVEKMSFSKDGQTLIIDGGIGIGIGTVSGGTFTPACQNINLNNNESTIVMSEEKQKGWNREPNFESLNFKDIPLGKTIEKKAIDNLLWEPSFICDSYTNSLAVIGRRGHIITLWNFLKGELIPKVDNKERINNASLLCPGYLIGITTYNKNKLPAEITSLVPKRYEDHFGMPLVTLIKLPEGTLKHLAIPTYDWIQCNSSPNGQFITGLIERPYQNYYYCIQNWDIKSSRMLGEISKPGQRILSFQWTSDSRFLIVRYTDQKGNTVSEFFTPEGKSNGFVKKENGIEVFSPSGNLISIQIEEPMKNERTTNKYLSVRKSRTGEEIARFKDFLCAYTSFIDEDYIISSNIKYDTVLLAHISDNRVLWETKVPYEFNKVIWKPNWNAVIVRYHLVPGSDILSIKDGNVIPNRDDDTPDWYNPTLLKGGRLALDSLPFSNVLHLKETATGRTIATFAAFDDSEWVIYTPDGLWTGSENALDWVAFYRGIEPLTQEEIKSLNKPEFIKARLSEALR